MIKRIRFASKRTDVTDAAFASVWPDAVAAAMKAPPEARPARITVCTALAEIIASPKHDGVGLEWFRDADHLGRFEAWIAGEGDQVVGRVLSEAVDVPASPVVVADEVVLRGADWLVRRWQNGGEKLKHMAIAHRAPGLTPAEFSARWKRRAGTVNVPGQTTVTIPDRARGLAYVQNHPQLRPDHEWAYDALNEVYFDDEGSLRERIEWFDATLRDRTEEDLVGEGWFVAAREEVVCSGVDT